MANFVTEDGLPWKTVADGVERKVIASQHEMVVLCRYTKSIVAPAHRHPEELISYVIAGRIELIVGEEQETTFECPAGSFYLVESNMLHGARVDAGTIEINAFSPPRSEYLDKAVTNAQPETLPAM